MIPWSKKKLFIYMSSVWVIYVTVIYQCFLITEASFHPPPTPPRRWDAEVLKVMRRQAKMFYRFWEICCVEEELKKRLNEIICQLRFEKYLS